MGPLRQISLITGCWVALTCLGCAPLQRAKDSVQLASNKVIESTVSTSSPPATQMLAVWQSELQSLPDPTQDSKMTYGLPGQIFLLTSGDTPATAIGDVTIAVHDETDRPNGQASPHKPEVWHITSDVLQRCVSRDERLGQCYVVFLPWRAEWTDVRKVRISTRYDVKDQPNMSLSSKDRRLVLEKQSLAMVQHSQRHQAQGAPDPSKIFAAMNSGQQVPQQQQQRQNPAPQFQPSNPVQSTGYNAVPNQPAMTPVNPVNPGFSVPPPSNNEIPPVYQPIIIQPRGN
jgi:hypothetical protein